jgi:hypothetical protein
MCLLLTEGFSLDISLCACQIYDGHDLHLLNTIYFVYDAQLWKFLCSVLNPIK